MRSAMTLLPRVSLTMDKATSNDTPLSSKVPRVREKRAISIFATRSPTRGRRKKPLVPAIAAVGVGHLPLEQGIQCNAAANQRPPPGLEKLACGDDDLGGSGRALPDSSNIWVNCGTTKMSNTTTDTTATMTRWPDRPVPT